MLAQEKPLEEKNWKDPKAQLGANLVLKLRNKENRDDGQEQLLTSIAMLVVNY